jgi:hypothetical protein
MGHEPPLQQHDSLLQHESPLQQPSLPSLVAQHDSAFLPLSLCGLVWAKPAVDAASARPQANARVKPLSLFILFLLF